MKKKESLSAKILVFLFALMVFIFGYTILAHLYIARHDSNYKGTLRELLELACVFCIVLSYFYAAKSFFVPCTKDKYSILENAIVLLFVAVFLFALSYCLIFAREYYTHMDFYPFSLVLFLIWICVSICFKCAQRLCI